MTLALIVFQTKLGIEAGEMFCLQIYHRRSFQMCVETEEYSRTDGQKKKPKQTTLTRERAVQTED